jgi:hypothetical protein
MFYHKSVDEANSLREACLTAFYNRDDVRPAEEHVSPRKRVMFIVSPKSGKGHAVQLYGVAKKYFE